MATEELYNANIIRRFDDGRIIMSLEDFHKLSEEEQIAELIGLGIEYLDEYECETSALKKFRDIYKKYCFDHGLTPDNWYLGIYE
nr:MAG TPA: hypothetical protein [Caudoviricetes sp.]